MTDKMSNIIDPLKVSEEDRLKIREMKEEANRIASENWDDPVWRREMAADLTEEIYRGFQHENLLSLYANVENLGFTDRSFVKEVRGLRAFWVSRGGYIEASDMRADVMEIPRDTIGFHVYEFEDKLRTNFAETQQSLVRLAGQRMDAEINLRVFSLFQAAVPSSSDYYDQGAGLSLASLNAALRRVRDESVEGNVAIIGRATMTDQIVDQLVDNNSYPAFLPESNEEMLRRGVLGVYRGARVITLKNYDDDSRRPFFPANELWVVGRDASKFAFFGGLLSKEYVEDDNWYWHYLARRDFGGVVHRPERLHRIVDTSQEAYTNKAS